MATYSERLQFSSEITDDPGEQVTETVDPVKRNNHGVRGLRAAVLLAIIVVTAGIVIFGRDLKRRQTEQFHRNFYNDAKTISETLWHKAFTTLGILDSLAAGIVSATEATNQSWPFVQIPNFGVLASKAMALTPLHFLALHPLVAQEENDLFQKWSKQHSGWIEETRQLQKQDENILDQKARYGELIDHTYKDVDWESVNITATEHQPKNTSLSAPFWMTYPIIYETVGKQLDILGYGNTILQDFNLDMFDSPIVSKVLLTGAAVTRKKEMEDLFIGKIIFDLINHISATSIVFYPIFSDSVSLSSVNVNESQLLGFLTAAFLWREMLVEIRPKQYAPGDIVIVVKDTCGEIFSFSINGGKPRCLGQGDYHDEQFDDLFFEIKASSIMAEAVVQCQTNLYVYPSRSYLDQHSTPIPSVTIAIAITFFAVSTAILLYSSFAQNKQQKIIAKASRSEAIVQSLFPTNVRERLLVEGHADATNRTDQSHTEDIAERLANVPIADLFPACSVIFMDLANFTAWSSSREPEKVIVLLETVFSAFDAIAERTGIFKVETVGDCYLAAAGLPEPRKDHALAVARFALGCMDCFKRLTRTLEVSLGPDTADLSLRIGIHSGQVIGAVIRGKRVRFQLFGDTVNTASRMESTGRPGMIQLSKETADLLTKAGKEHWLTPRSENVFAKGKGRLTTFWLHRRPIVKIGSTSDDLQSSDIEDEYWKELELAVGQNNGFANHRAPSTKTARLIQWTSGILMRYLRAMQVRQSLENVEDWDNTVDASDVRCPGSTTVFNEVQEIIALPKFGRPLCQKDLSVDLGPEVEIQLIEFLDMVARNYNDNPFHCFEHATHVTMSVSKLLSRIKAPGASSEEESDGHTQEGGADNTYGILDPMTQFACVFSALVHDLDHPGVSNTQLCKEHHEWSIRYNDQSVAEQHSLDLAFRLLEKGEFKNLRRAIYKTVEEKKRFRRLVVNMVMATDIMDTVLKALRNKRWERAFSNEHEECRGDRIDRKATIVIEHIIQASDVAHTMQHWCIYFKWNQRLFRELYKAHLQGRFTSDPSIFWYEGELGFFDNYIIPLAKKLCECGVFGVSGEEYLNYAIKNREEWEQKGRTIVAETIEAVQEEFGELRV